MQVNIPQCMTYISSLNYLTLCVMKSGNFIAKQHINHRCCSGIRSLNIRVECANNIEVKCLNIAFIIIMRGEY